MIRTTRTRMRAPVAAAAFGTVVAACAGIVYGWLAFVQVEGVALAGAIGVFLLAGSRTDLGAMFAGQPDERQDLLRLRARALGMQVMLMASSICLLILLLLRDWHLIWPFVVIPGIGLVAFLGRLAYGSVTGGG